jgi:drug/metabolite transporter (DMT)-like permease
VMRTISWSIAAGCGFGVFFVFLDRTSDHAGLWPLVAARPMSIALATAVALRRREPVLPSRTGWPLVAAAGAGDMGANILFLLASTHGDLAITGAVGSMYPVSTVALARLVDGERLRPTQFVGLGVALAALVLIGL